MEFRYHAGGGAEPRRGVGSSSHPFVPDHGPGVEEGSSGDAPDGGGLVIQEPPVSNREGEFQAPYLSQEGAPALEFRVPEKDSTSLGGGVMKRLKRTA